MSTERWHKFVQEFDFQKESENAYLFKQIQTKHSIKLSSTAKSTYWRKSVVKFYF